MIMIGAQEKEYRPGADPWYLGMCPTLEGHIMIPEAVPGWRGGGGGKRTV